MKRELLKYFEQKKISCVVKEIDTASFTTYNIYLDQINDFKKFNSSMQKELVYILKTNVTINTNDKIEIVINKTQEQIKNSMMLSPELIIGESPSGEVLTINFKDDPHWLIAGATGSGKSVFLNNVICYLLDNYSSSTCFGFVDFKKIEFYKYNDIMQNIYKVSNDIESADKLLNGAVDIMNDRYSMFAEENVNSIYDYNKKVSLEKRVRELFIVVDELAELILLDEDHRLLNALQRLLQLGRAAGVHVICATQRPSSDILPGILKVNFTTRICFKVGNVYDSRTILNTAGAETLGGKGDCYILKNGSFKLQRFQAYPPEDSNTILSKCKRAANLLFFV